MSGRALVVRTALALAFVMGSVGTVSAQTYRHTLTSGLFGLPAAANSVDWAVTNSSGRDRTIRVTVYRHGIGIPRAVVAPGALTVTLAPTETTHNANTVGTVFQRGFYYEVVVETNSLRVLPIVTIWEDAGNTNIPGTLIPTGSWVRLR